MKRLSVIFFAFILLFGGACVSPEPGEVPGPTNQVTEISISYSENILILRRGKDYLKIRSSNTDDTFRFFSAEAAPVFCVESKDPVTEEISLLMLKLPVKKIRVNRTALRVLESKPKLNGKKVSISKVLAITPDGKTLIVQFRDGSQTGEGQLDIQTGTLTLKKQGTHSK